MATSDTAPSFDILAALEASPSRGQRKCKLALTLDAIPEATPNLPALLAAVENAAGYPAQQLTLSFTILGLPVGKDVIADHRAQRCRCFR